MKYALLLSIFLTSKAAFSGNMATCILEKMPEVNNDVAAYATNKVCMEKYPELFKEIQKGDGLGIFGYESAAECTAKKSSQAKSNVAARMIQRACYCLYTKPSVPGESCSY